MANSALVDLVGRVLAQRYRLLAPVGTGASGRAYLADDIRLRRRVLFCYRDSNLNHIRLKQSS